jgi:hypothetical protein
LDAGVGIRLFLGRGSPVFRLKNHSFRQGFWLACGHEMSHPSYFPGFWNPVQLGGNHRPAARMGFQHYGGKGFGGDLWMNQTVEGMVEQDWVRLLSNQAGSVFESQMPYVVPQ